MRDRVRVRLRVRVRVRVSLLALTSQLSMAGSETGEHELT